MSDGTRTVDRAGPTLEEVRAAVLALPEYDRRILAIGPMPDPDGCRICDHFDAFIYGAAPEVDYVDAVLALVDYHRFYGSPFRDGRGPEAFRRCQEIYELARELMAA